MDLIKAQAMLANAELIHSEATVQAAVANVAAAIRERLAKLDFPLDFDYLHATRYGPETQGGKISWRSAPWTSVKGRSVLVVDDILDEGVTLAAVKESLRRMGAEEVLTAVFADKLNGKIKPIAADFVGLTVPDRFVFGFGMDAGGVWRNLPAVYAMKDDA